MTQIRKYQKEDFEKVKKILEQAGLYNPEVDTKERFKEKISRFQNSILVAEESNKIIGTVFITDDATNVLLTRLAVLPKHQGKGIGSQLVQKAEEILEERKVPISVAFAETEDEELKEWYKNIGYKEKGDYTMMWKDLE